MSGTAGYELLDFGEGRKLERFGPHVLDRPAPAAEPIERAEPPLWETATARYVRTGGEQGFWRGGELPPDWTIDLEDRSLQLKPTPFGHVGLFPEQVANWRWIAARLAEQAAGCRLLNLFAYTGGSTLAAAAAGAQVVHVDGAKNIIGWARRNAELSGLADAPIRWIAEDGPKFVRREVKRGNRYEGVILDPPSYGHGPAGQVWNLERDLRGLLADCVQLAGGAPRLLLLTCHTPGYGPGELRRAMQSAIGDEAAGRIEAGELALTARDGRRLASGCFARYAPEPGATEPADATRAE